MNTTVDLIGQGANGLQTQGNVAAQFAADGRISAGALRPFLATNSQGKVGRYISIYNGGNPALKTSYTTMAMDNQSPLAVNATLRRDEWKQLDRALVEVSKIRLNGIADLVSNNLTYQLGDAFGTTVLEWHDVSKSMNAEVTMDGITRGENDRPNYQYNYVPVPIIHSDYEINARVLAASRKFGNPIDTTAAEQAAWEVNDRLEKMLFTNVTFSFGQTDTRGRNTIYSYVNHPDRQTGSLTAAWDTSGVTGATIVSDVQAMKQQLISVHKYGPYTLYVPTGYETILDNDYSTSGGNNPNQTIRDRILKINNIKNVKVVDELPANTVLLVQMTMDTVRLVQGMGIQNIQWREEGNFVNKYKVMTIQFPQIRSDQDSQCGVCHYSV